MANTAAYSSVLYDIDGSLTAAVGGGPGSTVVPNIPFMHDRDGTDFQPPGWNAWVTDNVYAEFFTSTLNPNNASKNMSKMEYTSPARETATTTNNATRNRISVKLDDGFYSVRFPNGLGNLAEGFKFRLDVRQGPPFIGSALFRFIGIANEFTPSSGVEVSSWAEVEAATRNAYYRAKNGNLWVKRFISNQMVSMLPNSAVANVAATTTLRTPCGTFREPDFGRIRESAPISKFGCHPGAVGPDSRQRERRS